MEDNQGEEGGGEEYQYNDQEGYFDPIWVKALYDYDAANDTEISFRENDVVCITQDYGDGWWCGDLNGQVGRVPANYFEYLDQQYDNQQQEQQVYYDDQGQQIYYDDQGQQHYYDDQQQGYDDQQEQQYDDQQQYYDQQQQQQDQQLENDIYEQERKEKLRKKREDAKQEMRGLQENLKSQNENKEKLSAEIELLTKDSDKLEDEIRLLKLLKFLKLEIIKTEYDFDVDSDISAQSRQTGIAITSDIKAIRTILSGIKSSSAADQPKKQFDAKLEDIEKKFINNLNLLGACDILKKSLFLSLTQLETIISPPNTPSSSSASHPAYSNVTPILMSPPPPLVIPPAGGSSSSSSNTPSNPDSAQLYTPATSSTPNPFFSAPTQLLSDKDKRKSIKEAKKIEKLERKEEKKLEKLEKKEKKKDDIDSSPVWKPASKK